MLRIVKASLYSQSQYLHTTRILYVQRKYKMNSGTTNHIYILVQSPHTRLLLYNNYSITFTISNNYAMPLPYIIIVLLILSILTDYRFYSSTGFAESTTASLPSLETAAPCV